MAIMTLAGKNAIRANQIIQCKKECAERKITVKQWCADHQIDPSTYYRWQKEVWDYFYPDANIKPVCRMTIRLLATSSSIRSLRSLQIE